MKHTAKEPGLSHLSLEGQAQSEEMLIAPYLCCKPRKQVLVNFLKHKSNINNLLFNLSYNEIPGQSILSLIETWS